MDTFTARRRFCRIWGGQEFYDSRKSGKRTRIIRARYKMAVNSWAEDCGDLLLHAVEPTGVELGRGSFGIVFVQISLPRGLSALIILILCQDCGQELPPTLSIRLKEDATINILHTERATKWKGCTNHYCLAPQPLLTGWARYCSWLWMAMAGYKFFTKTRVIHIITAVCRYTICQRRGYWKLKAT